MKNKLLKKLTNPPYNIQQMTLVAEPHSNHFTADKLLLIHIQCKQIIEKMLQKQTSLWSAYMYITSHSVIITGTFQSH